MTPLLRAAAAVLLLVSPPLTASAAGLPVVQLRTQDLPDREPGQDLWRFAYEVEAFAYDAGHGLSILFEPHLYRDLAWIDAASDAAWDPLLIQPDPALPDFGLLDLLALADAPGSGGPFVVEAVWLGGGQPGSQEFYVYDPAFQPVPGARGRTVPEPGLALLAAGAGALALRRRRLRPRRGHGCGRSDEGRRPGRRPARRAVAAGAAGLLLGGCLPAVEHRADLGDAEVVFSQVSRERVGRAEVEVRFAARLEPKAPLATAAPRVVAITGSGGGTTVVEGTLLFPATHDAAAHAEAPFVIRQDRREPFDPAALRFERVTAPAPPLAQADPAPGQVAAVSAWPRLVFEEEVPVATLADFALTCAGAPHPVRVHAASPTRVVLNPTEDLPPQEDCALTWPSPGGAIAFGTGGVGSELVAYDRRDHDVLPPFPDDVHLVPDATTATGWRVAWPGIERPDPVGSLADALLAVPNTLDGWSPIGAVVVQLSAPPDEGSLPTSPRASLDPAASVRLYDVDPTSPDYGARIPFDLDVRTTQIGAGAPVHQMVLYPSRPLAPRTRHALVVTRQALAADGTPYARSAFFEQALAPAAPGEHASVGRARTLTREVLASVEEAAALPVPAEDTALVLSLRTRSIADIPQDVLALREDVDGLPAAPDFTIDQVEPGSGDVAAVVEGTWQIPDWIPNGYLSRDASGRPQLAGTTSGPFVLALPEAARNGPAPVTMYQHGNPGSAQEVRGEARDYLAGAGFATIGFSDPISRRFASPAAQFIDIFANLLTHSAIPDYYVQAYGEQLAFLRLIQEGLAGLDVLPLAAPDGVPDLDVAAPLTYVGISYGAVHGAALVPYAPEIRAAALVAGGGGFGERLYLQDETDPLGIGSFFQEQLPLIISNIRADDLWAGLQLVQMGYDAQDPNLHALYTYRQRLPVGGTTRKASLLFMEGIADSFSPANALRAGVFAAGAVPQLDPVAEAAPHLSAASGEVRGNVDPETSAALVQYVPAGVPGLAPSPGCELQSEGHYCVQSARDSELQRAAFFQSALSGGAPRILSRTLDSDGDGISDIRELHDGTDPESPLSP